jgi:hypothetical protein
MTPAKVFKIKKEFFRNNEEMSEALNTSGTKIGLVLKGEQKLQLESVGILLTTYKVDAEWFFNADDDAPLVLKDQAPAYGNKYVEAIEKLNMVQEELLEYKRQETRSLKNDSEFHV